jgi:hypothetical protein
MDLQPKDFPHNLVDFTVHKMKSTQTLWVNHQAFSPDIPFTKQNFSDEFGYGIQGNERFDDIEFDLTKSKIYKAERYGGIGIGRHGGGVRCGNNDKYQIKGIGKNPLASEKAGSWHSYGGLNLVDAIYESINSVVLQIIMPIGVATCYGLIITGDNTAFMPGKVSGSHGYGALMVREACLRPAHFIRARDFKLNTTQKHFILKDSARVRQVNKQLAVKFGETSSFISQFGRILSNFANQFAFARAARIIHGSLSTSNLCLDGRWLDLTNASFLTGGVNTAGSSSFYEEPSKMLDVIEEFIYTYAKYNQIQLNPQPLFNYYLEQFDAYFKLHISYVLGINFEQVEGGLKNKHYLFITDVFQKVITSADKISYERCKTYKSNDVIVCLLEGLFLSVGDKKLAQEKLAIALPNDQDKVDKLLKICPEFLSELYNKSSSKASYGNFLRTTSIIALKRTLIPEYYFMGRLELYIYELVTQDKKDKFEQVINDSSNIANWAFDKDLTEADQSKINKTTRNISLFESSELTVCFCPTQENYLVIHNEVHTTFTSYQNLITHLKNLPEDLFILSEYNFIKYLNHLGNVLSVLENKADSPIKHKVSMEVII